MPRCANHDDCVRDAMSRAVAVCQAQEARLTSLRRRVLELVWESHKPVKAYDILARMKGAAPPTVYRALDFLIRHGLVHKLHRWNAYIGCTQPNHPQPFGVLYCSSCGEVEEYHDSSLNRAIGRMTCRHHFTFRHAVVEIEGTCRSCQNH